MDIFAPAKKLIHDLGPRGAEANAADMVERRQADFSELEQRIGSMQIIAMERAEELLAERELETAARHFGSIAVENCEREEEVIDLTELIPRELVSID